MKKIEGESCQCHKCGNPVRKGDFEVQFGQLDTYEAEHEVYLARHLMSAYFCKKHYQDFKKWLNPQKKGVLDGLIRDCCKKGLSKIDFIQGYTTFLCSHCGKMLGMLEANKSTQYARGKKETRKK